MSFFLQNYDPVFLNFKRSTDRVRHVDNEGYGSARYISRMKVLETFVGGPWWTLWVIIINSIVFGILYIFNILFNNLITDGLEFESREYDCIL